MFWLRNKKINFETMVAVLIVTLESPKVIQSETSSGDRVPEILELVKQTHSQDGSHVFRHGLPCLILT